jgi:two-component system OmpR family sensor kinase
VKLPRSFTRLSIFGRTFLLMVTALLIAEGIGLTLMISRPPLHNAPVSLAEIARYLATPADMDRSRPPQFGGPPPPQSRDAFDRSPPPPAQFSPNGPPDRPRGPPSDEIAVRAAEVPPAASAEIDLATSNTLRTQLAQMLGIERESVLIYVSEDGLQPSRGGGPGETLLREGFIAARQLQDGSWRVIESIVEGFPNRFQQQAILLFAAGLAVLLPLAWLFAKALSAPIRRFSQAAKRVGTDPGAPPLPVEGPAEMLMAIESFNAMQARLNRLLQERTQMIAAVAHDLRTPLMRLAFRLDDLPAPLGEKVNADILEMKSMISSALDFIRDRSVSVSRERLDFRLLVESVVDDQSDLDHDVTLEAGEAITVEGDPLALRRAVVNVVDNAVKYGERARLRLRVDDGRCTLQVDDDGPGISASMTERVFEPFFRLESSRNRNTGGVGLGLAVVRATITDHGGDITLGNRGGGGLRVTLWLPVASRSG